MTTKTKLTKAESKELRELEAAFEQAGGRGVEMADRIDELRAKRDGESESDTPLPACLLQMGCLCAAHAKGRDAAGPCDAREDVEP